MLIEALLRNFEKSFRDAYLRYLITTNIIENQELELKYCDVFVIIRIIKKIKDR